MQFFREEEICTVVWQSFYKPVIDAICSDNSQTYVRTFRLSDSLYI